MRLTLAALLFMGVSAHADTFTTASTPTAVTVYPDFATVTRLMSLDMTEGAHEIILPDLPRGIDPNRLRVEIDGATLRSTRLRMDALPPAPGGDSAAISAARAAVERAERNLRDLDDQVEDARIIARAADARANFLSGLWSSETLPSDPGKLAGVANMIQAQTLDARRARVAAERTARDLAEERGPLEDALDDAQTALAALTPAPDPGALLALSVDVANAGPITVRARYPVTASWQPTYDILLDQEAETLDLRRGAIVTQSSAENWQGVALTLSTLTPSGQVTPSELYPPLLRHIDPATDAERRFGAISAEPSVTPPTEMAEAAPTTASFEGPGVSYQVADPVDVAPDADGIRVTLDTIGFAVRVFARAVPARDTTAFLMAETVNASAEPLLAAPSAQLFVDGDLVGQTSFDAVAAGEDVTFAFGPIEDLRLTRTLLDRSNSDRGLISRRNTRFETVRISVENLGPETWQIELRDAVPYSEQEDLQINWTAQPAPDQTNVEDRRGLLQWSLTLGAEDRDEIVIEQDIRWPEGHQLR